MHCALGHCENNMVTPVTPLHGVLYNSNTQQSNDSTAAPKLGLADRLIVNHFYFFCDNILHHPNVATVQELYGGLRTEPLTNHQVLAFTHPQKYASFANNQRKPN